MTSATLKISMQSLRDVVPLCNSELEFTNEELFEMQNLVPNFLVAPILFNGSQFIAGSSVLIIEDTPENVCFVADIADLPGDEKKAVGAAYFLNAVFSGWTANALAITKSELTATGLFQETFSMAQVEAGNKLLSDAWETPALLPR